MVEIHITKPEQVLGFPQKRLVGPPEDRKFKPYPFSTLVRPNAAVWALCQLRQQFGPGVPGERKARVS